VVAQDQIAADGKARTRRRQVEKSPPAHTSKYCSPNARVA
jgi:hypothetical protein